MSRKDLLKSWIPALFVILSYFIAEKYRVIEIIYSFENDNWNTTVSVAIYTAFLNTLLEYLLSKRSIIDIKIIDKKNKAKSLNVGDKPCSIEVTVIVEGNLSKIKEKIFIKFPKWIDTTIKGAPDITQSQDNLTEYIIDLSDDSDSGKRLKKTFVFDIVANEMYSNSKRNSEITAAMNYSLEKKFRYFVKIEGMTIFKN